MEINKLKLKIRFLKEKHIYNKYVSLLFHQYNKELIESLNNKMLQFNDDNFILTINDEIRTEFKKYSNDLKQYMNEYRLLLFGITKLSIINRKYSEYYKFLEKYPEFKKEFVIMFPYKTEDELKKSLNENATLQYNECLQLSEFYFNKTKNRINPNDYKIYFDLIVIFLNQKA